MHLKHITQRPKTTRRTITATTKIDSREADTLLPRFIPRIKDRRDIGKVTVHFIIVRGSQRRCER